MENDNICAVGRVRSPSEDTLLNQTIIHEKQNTILENEFSLESEDIYKELRVMGYDYSGEFQRLKKIRTNNFVDIHGICEWNGKPVAFLDGLLQSMVFAAPFRKLMVPVMIKSIRIDPKVLFEAINHNKVTDISMEDEIQIEKDEMRKLIGQESIKDLTVAVDSDLKRLSTRFCLFQANMPFYFNAKSKLLLTHGIEVEDVMAFPIPRKAETSNLIVDTYEFCPNEDNNAIEAYDRKNIMEYLEVCLNTLKA